MPKMLYHDDPDWYERPGQTVEIPLGAALTRSRAYIVPDLPWKNQRDIAPSDAETEEPDESSDTSKTVRPLSPHCHNA